MCNNRTITTLCNRLRIYGLGKKDSIWALSRAETGLDWAQVSFGFQLMLCRLSIEPGLTGSMPRPIPTLVLSFGLGSYSGFVNLGSRAQKLLTHYMKIFGQLSGIGPCQASPKIGPELFQA